MYYMLNEQERTYIWVVFEYRIITNRNNCFCSIGYAIAKRLGNEGASVVISSRKEKNVHNAVNSLRDSGIKYVEGVVCHVGNAEQRKKLFEVVSISTYI